jgi:hypothetical protein
MKSPVGSCNTCNPIKKFHYYGFYNFFYLKFCKKGLKKPRCLNYTHIFNIQTWIDQTCVLGYSVAGTWNNINYKNDPTMTTAIHVGNHKTRLAAGDTHGYLRLFQYPCTSPRAEYQEAKPSR